jgi:ketosteroid isomerase-like protein
MWTFACLLCSVHRSVGKSGEKLALHSGQESYRPVNRTIESLDKNDAAAVAANFTEDGVFVTPNGTFFGRKAIEKNMRKTSSKDSVQARIVPLQMTIRLTS